jgi:hypothetical protein
VIGALLVVICIALSGPAFLVSLAAQTWQQVHARLVPPVPTAPPPPSLRASQWAAIGLPSDRAFVRDVIFRPATSTPLVAYICGLSVPTGGTGGAPLALYVTWDGAHSWQALASPVVASATCDFVVDVNQPQHVVLLTTVGAQGSCDAPNVYLSATWGATWQPVTLPPPLDAACAPSFYLVNGRLYAWSQDGRYAAGGPPGSPLMASDDDGATWSTAFEGLSASALPSILGAHADGSLLVRVVDGGSFDTSPAAAPALWCRDGVSGRWSLLADLPGLSSDVVFSANPAVAGCSWAPLYAFYAFAASSGGQSGVASLAVLRGSSWHVLPAVPVDGASGRQTVGAVERVLGVGTGGTLLLDVPDTSAIADASSPPYVIWGWNPPGGTWQRDDQEEPGNARIDGFSWDDSQAAAPKAVLWLFSVNWGVPAFTGVFRSSFTAE